MPKYFIKYDPKRENILTVEKVGTQFEDPSFLDKYDLEGWRGLYDFLFPGIRERVIACKTKETINLEEFVASKEQVRSAWEREGLDPTKLDAGVKYALEKGWIREIRGGYVPTFTCAHWYIHRMSR
ncbi:MAG: hypothetical protein JSW08_02295 [archaeon]|nr:MAG: hypothetical protein JSW08_02295 [archaeon]